MWHQVAKIDDLVENSGVCVLIEGKQIALFKLQYKGESKVFAMGNFDPIGKANVLSRGILGSIGEQWVVASPLYKQHFDLHTGICLEQPDKAVSVYPVRIDGQHVNVELTEACAEVA